MENTITVPIAARKAGAIVTYRWQPGPHSRDGTQIPESSLAR
jgi:hypothetical protein